ncbi:hypothetical protein NKR23_g9302 [Pleurostoma richardsiae]|uniref:Uncharacterized protein n=1 Tax=Pleurostoma richardsiae TaxID=41990 RepID=A0AA38VEW5_9PEZI|nr:hypothetical protein NKR23_g9302 [Pleurostoma richardsiae]
MGLRIFGPKRRAPPTHPEDEVVPVHVFDDLPDYRKTLMMWTFQFNDVLDPNRLNNSLHDLIAEEGRLTDHMLASQLPSLDVSCKSSTFLGPQAFVALGVPGDAPKTIEDYLNRDEPQIAVHVNVFADATLVSVQFLHTVTDALGFASLMKAWQAALAGKIGQVPRLEGLRDDPMAAFYTAKPTERHVLIDKDLTGWRLLLFILRFVWNRLAQGDFETRTIRLSSKAVAAMRSIARSQLPDADVEGSPVFISDGDILTAWAGQLAAQTGRSGSVRPVTILIPADVRSRTRDVFPEGSVCVQNAILVVYVPLAASHLRMAQLGKTALEVRRAITRQTTRAQFDALARRALESMEASNHPPLMCDTGSGLVSVTNWSKAGFLDEIDFSPAVVTPGTNNRSGRVVYYHSHWSKDPFFTSPMFTIKGKDGEGNYWLTGHLPSAGWLSLEKQLENFEEKH